VTSRRRPRLAPPAWRHWLWPIGILIAGAVYICRPHTSPGHAELLPAHLKLDARIKTISLAQSGQTCTGTLTDGKDFTTIIPAQAGSPF